MRTMIRRGVGLCLAVALAACGDDDGGFSPTVEDVAGSYTAATFTFNSVDLLALGATVTATLDPDGTTTGRLFVPGGGQNGEDLDEDLEGTWSLSGTTVTFSPAASTFLSDVDFAAGPNTLTGEGTFQGAVIRLVMTKD